jgi:hypothetical protein
LFVLFLFLTPKEKRFDFFKKIAIAGNIILVMFAVNYQKFFELLKYNNFWVAPPAPDSFSKIFHSFFGDSEIVLFLIMPLLFYYLLLVFKNNENKIISCQNLFNNKIQFGFIILFTWFFVFFSYLMIKSYGKISYLLTRYFISISPVIFIILGIAIKKIKGLVTRGIVLFLLCFFMLVHLFVVKKQYYTIHHAQYREAAAFVIKNNPNAITTYSNQEYWYNFYFNKTKTKIVLKNLSLNKVCEKFIKTPTDIKSFWYIDAFKRFDSVKQSSKDFLDKNGNPVEDRIYNRTDFDKNIVVDERRELVARKITEFLKGNDRFAKTIVFCIDIEHAEGMRTALANSNSDLVAQNNKYVMQITGAASVTVIGVGQRIENNNSYDLAGQTVTLSVNMSNSLLTNVTWTASYANTSNTFGTIGTPTKTQISTGTFTVNSTITQYSTQIAIPAAATTGVEILFTVGAQTSGTWVIGNAQLEVGSSASAFEYADYTTQLIMCQRYCQVINALNSSYRNYISGTGIGNTGYSALYPFAVVMRTVPTGSISNSTSVQYYNGSFNATTLAIYIYEVNSLSQAIGVYFSCGIDTSGVIRIINTTSSATCVATFSAEL